ncbi:hypothetical protein POK33_38130 [Burkholderia cenocepacia]|uniref:hypothetical protein n=1 Tax=Burkholderia cenocepacia TaxID=95486 RepID=UPI0023B8EC84|nr:hypothetical protein [Burkholderia cenocepacia]MDF0506574.1 hypothetical protein [Burkholderia cenocepacia]
MDSLIHCEHCQVFSGRYNMNRRCCQVRLIASMPKAHRLAAFAKVRAESGGEVADRLRADVLSEYHRHIAHKSFNKK